MNDKTQTIMMDGFPVEIGDRMWSIRFGWITVIDIRPGYDYCIHGKSENGIPDTWKANGDYATCVRDLYWDEVQIVPPPKPEKKTRWWYRNILGTIKLTGGEYTAQKWDEAFPEDKRIRPFRESDIPEDLR